MLVPSTSVLCASGSDFIGYRALLELSSAGLELTLLQPQTPVVLSEPCCCDAGHFHSRLPPAAPLQQWHNKWSMLPCRASLSQ